MCKNDSSVASAESSKEDKKSTNSKYDEGTNYVEAGIEANTFFFCLIVLAPFLSLLLGYLTSDEMATKYPNMATSPINGMLMGCVSDIPTCGQTILNAGISVMIPTKEAIQFILSFMIVALILERTLPGNIEYGPETLTGHIPQYVDNAILHCIAYSLLFYLGSNVGPLNLYNLGIMYDVFPGSVAFLNLFGIVFCIFLTLKGLYYPSTQDAGSSGSIIKDYLWGTELYPRIMGLDLKRFINCRFSMTFWQLAGISFCYKSYVIHNHTMDWGLFFSALSQYLYLCKFFLWEMGYMRSIDIIVDRAGFEIQWGCLVWVPAVYTLHTRFCVQYSTQLSFTTSLVLFMISMLGVIFNYLADRERDIFRATNGQCSVLLGFIKKPTYIIAEYEIVDRTTGQKTIKKSLLLASGFWGIARHFQYFFELTAAWSWCLLANPFYQNGIIPLFYCLFLTYLLIDRAERDSKKCSLKYGKYYNEYCQLVPYKIIPGIY